jgi:hypothetical protein
MDIYFQVAIGPCDQLIMDGKKQTANVVISPLKVDVNEEKNAIKASYGCNLWKSCGNKSCQYSLIAHPAQTKKGGL